MKKKDVLQCEVCKKEFFEFDQRGFRNAGFTAHQNRCIERQNRERNPEQLTPKRKRRLLLPASPNPTRSGTSPPSVTHPPSAFNYSSSPSVSSLPSFQSAVITTAPILVSTSAAYTPIPAEHPMNYQPLHNTSMPTMYSIISYCGYCNLGNGLHASTCPLFLSK
ncbi:hypothetical protein BCV72DRAFT_306839 [Rhizopus microsporus var. microsporus]|uniref:Uncharacterized protein n=2 Tax=Rhizopus microsporus TaxID=58291 RepID=A0A2G4SNY0_RHIZD|nr:uncharacterized protein RHIMIDRAFT_239952 [Rhizopus microsporus ATCC 52813]ORE04937.1 hypothetical protein BCV72DRAFT_306839 [Rhizopus microsporus var. microsporus]PHZ10474.1 hypothetical protein RHIMIDRAFT_239952 [Rhizopus microsporus ATCC 52813]